MNDSKCTREITHERSAYSAYVYSVAIYISRNIYGSILNLSVNKFKIVQYGCILWGLWYAID